MTEPCPECGQRDCLTALTKAGEKWPIADAQTGLDSTQRPPDASEDGAGLWGQLLGDNIVFGELHAPFVPTGRYRHLVMHGQRAWVDGVQVAGPPPECGCARNRADTRRIHVAWCPSRSRR